MWADRAIVHFAGMDGAYMVFEVSFDPKACATWHSIMVVLVTHERSLLALVNNRNMFLERVMFPELLSALGNGTGKILSLKMLLVVPLQSGRCDETLAAALPGTSMVPLVFVRRFDVVLEV